MTPVEHPQQSVSTDFAGVLRKRLEAVPLKVLSVDLSYDESHIGKFLKGGAALPLAHVSKLVEIAGLKAVGKDRHCSRPEELRYLRGLYARVNEHAPWLLDEAES